MAAAPYTPYIFDLNMVLLSFQKYEGFDEFHF